MERTIIAVEASTGSAIAVVFQLLEEIDVKEAVKAAVLEYLQTPAGQKSYQANCEAFNWGDLVNDLPKEICLKHKFFVKNAFPADEVVDLNEQLVSI